MSFFPAIPSSGDTGSPSGSPPSYISMDAAYYGRYSLNVDKRLTDAAKDTLGKLTDFCAQTLQPSDKTDPALITALTEISEDIFSDPLSLSDENLDLILKNCPSMRHLYLYGFHQITDIALESIAKLKHLSTLNLSGSQVKCLAPLINQPIMELKAANFYDTPVNFEAMIFFVQRHSKSLRDLIPPQNPPPEFFDSLLICRHLQFVKVQYDEGQPIPFVHINGFFQKAAELQRLVIIIHGSVARVSFDFNANIPVPTTRTLVFQSNNVSNNFQLNQSS